MTVEEIRRLLVAVSYRGWTFEVIDRPPPYLQLRWRADGNWQSSRKWLLSPHMTRSEVVQTAFKAVLAAEEHEAREHFLYRGRPIFGPHFEIDALLAICDRTDTRTDVPKTSPDLEAAGGP